MTTAMQQTQMTLRKINFGSEKVDPFDLKLIIRILYNGSISRGLL